MKWINVGEITFSLYIKYKVLNSGNWWIINPNNISAHVVLIMK